MRPELDALLAELTQLGPAEHGGTLRLVVEDDPHLLARAVDALLGLVVR
jgi:hypothetical protein